MNELLKRKQLIELINNEFNFFKNLNFNHKIVPNSIPIIWFGNAEKYLKSELKIITVSLNPSDIEFKEVKTDTPSTNFRFSEFDGTAESIYRSYNNYFTTNPYNTWFKSSFDAVLKSFSASHYDNAINTAIHTDIGCPYATNPTWGGLTKGEKSILEPIGTKSWHNLVEIIEPDLILISASPKYEKKIQFPQVGDWSIINIKSKSPLLRGEFKISNIKKAVVLFQVQGRKPFLQTSKEEKLKFKQYL